MCNEERQTCLVFYFRKFTQITLTTFFCSWYQSRCQVVTTILKWTARSATTSNILTPALTRLFAIQLRAIIALPMTHCQSVASKTSSLLKNLRKKIQTAFVFKVMSLWWCHWRYRARRVIRFLVTITTPGRRIILYGTRLSERKLMRLRELLSETQFRLILLRLLLPSILIEQKPPIDN